MILETKVRVWRTLPSMEVLFGGRSSNPKLWFKIVYLIFGRLIGWDFVEIFSFYGKTNKTEKNEILICRYELNLNIEQKSTLLIKLLKQYDQYIEQERFNMVFKDWDSQKAKGWINKSLRGTKEDEFIQNAVATTVRKVSMSIHL